MRLASFDLTLLTEEHKTPDGGDAFEKLAFDLLRCKPAYASLRPPASKAATADGAIDFEQVVDGRRTVVECKKIGKDGFDAARDRWQAVLRKLRHNLEPGDTPRLSQFECWYDQEIPIIEYAFCVSSELENSASRDRLKKRIVAGFEELSSRPHLAHLKDIQVVLFDWPDFSLLLEENQHIAYRWFPDLFPAGFLPLVDRDPTRFQSFLTSNKLPFYSRREHIDRFPESHVGVEDEQALLDLLSESEYDGLIISGGGGLGKTRLMLELGLLAEASGWLVGRVSRTFSIQSLSQIAKGLSPDQPALVLIDYIEVLDNFTLLLERIRELNESERNTRIHYIATCRTSYFWSIRQQKGYYHVDLSPKPSQAAFQWFEEYREHTVEHILNEGGIKVSAQMEAACKRLPFLAVFAYYLSHFSEKDQQARLMEEGDFSSWIAGHIEQIFVKELDDRFRADLAGLFASLPFSESYTEQLSDAKYDQLEKLLKDEWIEERAEEGETMLYAVHDALADQIVYDYIQELKPSLRKRYVKTSVQRSS